MNEEDTPLHSAEVTALLSLLDKLTDLERLAAERAAGKAASELKLFNMLLDSGVVPPEKATLIRACQRELMVVAVKYEADIAQKAFDIAIRQLKVGGN